MQSAVYSETVVEEDPDMLDDFYELVVRRFVDFEVDIDFLAELGCWKVVETSLLSVDRMLIL